MQRSTNWTLVKLKLLHKAGRLIVERRRGLTLDGKTCWTPVYRLK